MALNRSLFGAHRLIHSSLSPTIQKLDIFDSFFHKGFSEINTESTGKALHGLYVKGFVPFSVFHSNTLLNMYAKFEHIIDARNVFDEMPERNEASWNTMMSGYVRVRAYRKAFQFFGEMSVKPSGFLISSLVTGIDKSGSMFGEGSQVHGFVVKLGLLCDVFVGTSLLHFYGTYGLVSDSYKLFDEMPERNVVTWTSLMVSYLDGKEFDKVIEIYGRMRIDNVCCNENTIALVFKTCGMIGDEHLGFQVLGHVVKSGLETNVSVANSLIYMYGCCGYVEEAGRVFDRMTERDTISWNSIVSANSKNGLCEETLRCFHRMRRDHGDLNSSALSAVLTVCGSSDNLKWGKGIHGLVIKLGLESNVCVGNTLLNMYSETGKLDDAELVFRGMPEKDSISWNSMVSCYAQNEESRKAMALFSELRRTSQNISFVTITSALAACSNREFVAEGKVIHALATLVGLQANLVVGNALVTMYGKSGVTVQARKVLEIMPERDDVTWNALIGCHSENEEPNEAVKAFNAMREEGVRTNYITVVNVLGALLNLDCLCFQGMPIHGYAVRAGFDSDKQVQTSLVTTYAKCGDLKSSNALFEGLSTKHSITWNAVIAANARHGHGEGALNLISKMRRECLRLDQFSLSLALAVCADLAVLEEGQQLHGLAVKLGYESDHYVVNAAMDMYGKCGKMDNVLRLLPSSANMTRLSWNVLISSYAKHGRFDKAKESFREMLESGINPDHVTFVSLLSACSHGGLVDDGLRYYALMASEFGVSPAIEHCVCIIDLLGRSGRLREADEFVTRMPVPPNDLVWRSLLASCMIHRELGLGKKAAEKLLEMDPGDDSAYVLYSNVCAATGRWDEVESVWTQMESNRIRKRPACSWVKVRNQVNMVGVGEKSHPWTSPIYAEL